MSSPISTSVNRAPYPGWIFFTYPRTSILPIEFAKQLIELLHPLSYTVVQERHQTAGDENPLHLHALVNLPNRKWTTATVKNLCRNVYPDNWKRIHFGRIVKYSNPHKAYLYCLKDPVGQVLQYGPPPGEYQNELLVEYAKRLGITVAKLISDAAEAVASARAYDLALARKIHRKCLTLVLRQLLHYTMGCIRR